MGTLTLHARTLAFKAPTMHPFFELEIDSEVRRPFVQVDADTAQVPLGIVLQVGMEHAHIARLIIEFSLSVERQWITWKIMRELVLLQKAMRRRIDIES